MKNPIVSIMLAMSVLAGKWRLKDIKLWDNGRQRREEEGKTMKQWDKGFMCGAALICADLIRTHGMSTEVSEIVGWHVKKADCIAAGVDKYDMDVLAPMWENLEITAWQRGIKP